MKLSIYQVDAFSKGPFTGNPAAVVPLTGWLPDLTMQQIAEENNLAETAFFIPDGSGYHIRWFTPTVEVALCGHATLATAFVLFDRLQHDSDIIHFNCQSGDISVNKDGDLLTLDFPADQLDRMDPIPEHLSSMIGIQPLEVFSGREDMLCIVKNQASIEGIDPDFAKIAQLEKRGIIVSAPGDDEFDFVSRCFYPQFGIDEDPATGSAHTTLTPYWSDRLSTKELSACQLSSRKGYFKCTDMGSRTLISGKADLYLEGKIYI